MKNLWVYFKVTTMFILVMILCSLLPVSYNRTFFEKATVKTYTIQNKVEEKEEVLSEVKEEEPEEVVVVTKPKVQKKEKVITTPNTVVSKPKEEKTEEKVENTSKLGSISISNSNFKKDLIMDDGTYFYLNHDLNGKYNGVGMPIIDSRTNFNTRKTILYAHSAKNGKSPFNYLQNYHKNENFYKSHKYIYVQYEGKNYKYEIFSVYVSLANDDYSEGLEYFRVMHYSDVEWQEKINWYKSNSEYETDVSVSGNDKILILQTCSMDDNYYHKYYRANLLVMGKLIEG